MSITLTRIQRLFYEMGPWSRRLDPWPAATADHVVAIRAAAPEDRADLERLAALDSQRPLRGDVLLALVDGEPWAAISLFDDRVTADPFRPTAHAVDLLRVRARHLRRPDPGRPLPSVVLLPGRAAG